MIDMWILIVLAIIGFVMMIRGIKRVPTGDGRTKRVWTPVGNVGRWIVIVGAAYSFVRLTLRLF